MRCDEDESYLVFGSFYVVEAFLKLVDISTLQIFRRRLFRRKCPWFTDQYVTEERVNHVPK